MIKVNQIYTEELDRELKKCISGGHSFNRAINGNFIRNIKLVTSKGIRGLIISYHTELPIKTCMTVDSFFAMSYEEIIKQLEKNYVKMSTDSFYALKTDEEILFSSRNKKQ